MGCGHTVEVFLAKEVRLGRGVLYFLYIVTTSGNMLLLLISRYHGFL
jgi:hypothetical protein